MSIKINEISVSTTGVDAEFLELIGDPGTDVSTLSILEVADGGEVVDQIELTGHIGVNGFYLVTTPRAEEVFGVTGNLQVSNNTFNNSSRTYMLVDGYTGAVGDDIDPNDDGVIDFINWDSVVDSVAPISGDSPLIYSPNVIGPDGTFLAAGGFRDPAGSGAFTMHAFSDFSLYSPTAGSDVLINEIVVSTTGSDAEFIEFVGLPGLDLTGYSLLEIEPGGEIDTVIDLTGATGAGNGRYLVASPEAEARLGVTGDQAMSNNTFTNGSRTYLLVEGFSGVSGEDIDADDDGIIDYAPWLAISDSVAPIDDDAPLIYSKSVIGPDGSFLAPGGYRDASASGIFLMHDFSDFSLFSPEAASPFVINEIVVSTTGTDTEFVEVYGAPNADLSTISILEIGSGGLIKDVVDLTGSTGSNGFYLIASPAAQSTLGVVADQEIPNNTFTNVSATYLMVEGFTGVSGDDIDADDDGLIDFALWSTIYDSAAPIDDDNPLIYSKNVIGPDGAFLAAGGYRQIVGVGDFVMHSFSDNSMYSPTPGNTTIPLVINEIVVSTTSTDREFLELFGEAGTDLSGYSILEVDPGGEIDTVIGLTGAVGDNGYYLLTSPEAVSILGVTGNQMISNNTFTNGSRTYLLVDGFSGASGDDIDADDDGVIDYAPWTEITDSVAPIGNDSPLIYSDNVVGPDGIFLAAGGYRDPEGTGAFVMHDFSDTSLYSPTAGTSGAPVVINEIVVSTTSTDREFLELFGTANTDLSTLSILEVNSGGQIDSVIELTGQTGDNGYYLLASPEAESVLGVTGDQSISNNTFTNASQTYMLVENFSGASGDDIDIDDDGVVDFAPWSSIWDSVAPIGGDTPVIYSNNVIGPDGIFLAAGGYRNPEGTGDFVMHSFNDTTLYSPTASNGGDGGGGGGGGGAATEVFIHDIQGTTDTSPLVGSEVIIEAIVVGDFQNGDADVLRDLGGFYVQEEAGDHDGDLATSEGLFVYDIAVGADVQLGDKVRITGIVSEFQGQTQISASSVSVVEAGAVADVNTMAVSVSLDAVNGVITDGAGKYAPDMESFEGMIATFTDTLTVNEVFQLDRFNEIRLYSGGQPEQFTQIYEPDATAYDLYEQQVGSDQIIFDDGLNVQNAPILPEADLNGDGVFDTSDGFGIGDTISGLTGIMSYTWAGNAASGNSWRVRSVDDGNTFEDTNTRDETPPDVGGELKVASFNVLNFFTTIDVAGNAGSGPSALDPRGADSVEEYDRQLEKLVTTLTDMDADVFGLVELENEFQTDQNGDGLVALNALVDALNAYLGSVTYAAVDPGRTYVDVSDAISVGMIYNVNTVSLVADSVHILDDSALPAGYTSPLFDGDSTNRAPLAATFEDAATGEDFTVAVVHMKSKGGSGTGADADLGDGAGAFNDMRTQGVEAVQDWLDGFADDDLLVLGDFNAYAMEDPVDAMLNGGFTDLAAGGSGYVFDGKTGTLDYAFGSSGIMDNVTGAEHWTINSDEPDAIDYNTDFGRDTSIFDGSVPFRTSDHDPVLVGLTFDSGPEIIMGTSGIDYLVGTDADEIVMALGGPLDVVSGGGGADVFEFFDIVGARDVMRVTDYDASEGDVLDLGGATYTAANYGGTSYLFLDGADRDLVIVQDADISDIVFGNDLLTA